MKCRRFCVLKHRSDEAIASPGDGFDVFASVRAIAQDLSQIEDVPGEIAFLDENTGPNFFEQLSFFYYVARPLDQHEKGFQVLWREVNGLAIAQQHPLHRVELIRAESV